MSKFPMTNVRCISVLALAVLATLPWAGARAALLFSDHFDYASGANLGSISGGGGAAWTLASGDVSQIKVNAAAALTSPSGYAAASGLGVAVTPTGTRKQTGVPFNGTTGIPMANGNVVYASFLLNVQTLPAAGNMRVAYLHDGAASQGGIEVVVSSTGQIGIQKKGSGTAFVTGTPVANPGTHLVVMRYTFQTGTDEVAVWADPDSSSYGVNPAPTNGAFAATTSGGSDMSAAITYFVVESAAVTGPVFWIDELHVGTTWAAVTSAGGPVTPVSVPVITQAVLSPQGMILRGSNGPADGTYQVLAGTSATLSLSNWSSIATRAFDSNGHFDSTNPITTGLAQQFFRLLVGGELPPLPAAPTITNQPQNLTVGVGDDAVFLVGATGTAPLLYFWLFNTNTPVGNDSSTLALNNAQANHAGSYRVIISNSAGSVTSSVATLAVLGSPVITAQPQNQSIALSNTATFTVIAGGIAPLTYQWMFNTNTPVGGNSNTLVLSNIQSNNAGAYSVRITNNYGAITSSFATLTVGAPLGELTRYNLVGFGEGTTGGGVIPEADAAYRKVYTVLELATAVRDANKTAGSVKVIEIMNDLNLGWNEIDPAAKSMDSTPFSQPATPLLHPVLLATGVSTLQISPKSGLTIFSANGATIRRASWSLKNTANIIIRNLKFDELWEWDEQTKGGYDRNNWDFIVIGVGGGTVSRVWIDHCTFTKAYDGITDNKGGCWDITYSWNKYMGDDGETDPNSFVWQQINALEATHQSNPASNGMYSFLRSAGFSTTNIFKVLQGPGKLLAIGELSKDPVNANSVITFHHQWYINPSDRIPRLAGGQAHNYNIFADCTGVLAARRMRDAIYNAMTTAQKNTYISRDYSFSLAINGSISTEDGAMLVEKSVYIDCNWPLRNNQTDPSDPTYTGKIKALDTIYSYLETSGSTTYVRGDSTDPGNPLGPFQATIKPFSWNTNASMPNAQLPYTYTMDDPVQLQSIVTSPTEGAGAGVLNWNKTNWLKTSY
jgi:pectate lyase